MSKNYLELAIKLDTLMRNSNKYQAALKVQKLAEIAADLEQKVLNHEAGSSRAAKIRIAVQELDLADDDKELLKLDEVIAAFADYMSAEEGVRQMRESQKQKEPQMRLTGKESETIKQSSSNQRTADILHKQLVGTPFEILDEKDVIVIAKFILDNTKTLKELLNKK